MIIRWSSLFLSCPYNFKFFFNKLKMITGNKPPLRKLYPILNPRSADTSGFRAMKEARQGIPDDETRQSRESEHPGTPAIFGDMFRDTLGRRYDIEAATSH